ncbi:hypothetical protein ANO11243_058900 [Dothideomycetidae sp. 11243]|nr:hypothetical protein ANO11243_058900 [fungal sp. No.11243]
MMHRGACKLSKRTARARPDSRRRRCGPRHMACTSIHERGGQRAGCITHAGPMKGGPNASGISQGELQNDGRCTRDWWMGGRRVRKAASAASDWSAASFFFERALCK